MKKFYCLIYLFPFAEEDSFQSEICIEHGPFTLDVLKHRQLPGFVVETVWVLVTHTRRDTLTLDMLNYFNPLRAKFFRVNINIYLYFVSFLHTNYTQVVEILPRVRQRPAYST